MIPSRYNLVTKMDDQNFALFNPLSGAFDIVDEKFADSILKGTLPSESDRTVLLERGYFFQSKSAEEAYIQERYQDFLNESSLNKTQFLLVPSYSCNFHCPYCYQKGVPSQSETMSNEMVYSFVDFIKKYKMLNRKEIMVTLFGGEPLLPGSARKETVRLLIELLNQNDVGLSVVTNGYYFEEYLEILKAAKIEEIHFTLDGDAEIHNRRRFEKEGENSFERIIRAMGKAVEVGFPVNLRLITDRLTLETFPALAVKLEQAGFPDLPKDKFKTSLGRNYELYNDYIKPEDLFTLDQMVSAYVNKMMAYPILKKLHRPSFFGMTQLVENREMFLPSFDTCPGAKSEYVFDASGKIFSCTASCGRDGYAIGTFYPELKFEMKETQKWRDRNILSIPECRDCSVGVVCGGGCAVIARETNGDILSPNCKPVKEIMDIGIRYYKDVLLNSAEED